MNIERPLACNVRRLGHLDLAGAGQLCHRGTEQTDRPRANDRYRVSRENTGITAGSVVSNTTGLCQGRHFKGHRGGNVVQDAFGHFCVLSHCSVNSESKPAPARIQVIQATVNKRGVFVDDGRGFTDNSIAFPETANVLARLNNYSGELVTQYDRIVYFPAVLLVSEVNIRAAHADRLNG